MKQTSRWRSRLTGSMLGQLQLATYAAVLLGFTGATTTGLWLSERNQKRLGEAELRAAANALTRSWSSNGRIALRHKKTQLEASIIGAIIIILTLLAMVFAPAAAAARDII